MIVEVLTAKDGDVIDEYTMEFAIISSPPSEV